MHSHCIRMRFFKGFGESFSHSPSTLNIDIELSTSLVLLPLEVLELRNPSSNYKFWRPLIARFGLRELFWLVDILFLLFARKEGLEPLLILLNSSLSLGLLQSPLYSSSIIDFTFTWKMLRWSRKWWILFSLGVAFSGIKIYFTILADSFSSKIDP